MPFPIDPPVRPFETIVTAAVLALCIAASASAQVQPPPPIPPPGTEAAQQPPAFRTTDPDLEPQVTIIRNEAESREEVRMGGELKFIKVTPRHGVPYYLVPQSGGTFQRRNSLDTSLSVPMWVLFSW